MLYEPIQANNSWSIQRSIFFCFLFFCFLCSCHLKYKRMSSRTEKIQRVLTFFLFSTKKYLIIHETTDLASLDFILIYFHRRLRFSKDISWHVQLHEYFRINNYCLILKRRYLLPFLFIYMWVHTWHCSFVFQRKQFNALVNFNRNVTFENKNFDNL